MARVSDLNQKNGLNMPSGQSFDERIDALLPFADCVNQNLEIGLMEAWDVKAYVGFPLEAKRRLGGSDDPYYLAFARGLLEIAERVHDDDRISIICDDDLLTAWDCYQHYRAVRKAEPKTRKTVGLTFADSEHFPALQAADMVAYLSRRHAREKFYGKQNDFRRLFEYLTTEPEPHVGIMKWLIMFASEEKLIALANDLTKLPVRGSTSL